METERKLVEYICTSNFGDLPPEPLNVVKNMVLTVLGTTIAGAQAEGCKPLVDLYRGLGGAAEATILNYGGKIPAENAALVNGVMARALDFCDAVEPGLHIGSSVVPAALAAAELVGSCSGRTFLTALTLGTEVAARLNLTEAAYDGFDPTGVCAVFAAAAAAAKILQLDPAQTRNALALAFNKSGGSFQSNIDGSLAVRVIQGWVAQSGVSCARLARAGITGPSRFLEGVYGYFHLYGKELLNPEGAVAGLGEKFELQNLMFKKFPSCGGTLGSTEVILRLIEENQLEPEMIDHIDVTVPPYIHKLVGHEFQIGNNPRVNAQFSIQYCVANALIRKSSRLHHFEESSVRDPEIMPLAQKVRVISDPALDARGHTALDMQVFTTSGNAYLKKMDIAPGFPGNPLTQTEHEERFWDCMNFAARPVERRSAEKIISLVTRLEQLEDIRILIPLIGS
jgi:2-methylcitrate dehydratase PrpD